MHSLAFSNLLWKRPNIVSTIWIIILENQEQSAVSGIATLKQVIGAWSYPTNHIHNMRVGGNWFHKW